MQRRSSSRSAAQAAKSKLIPEEPQEEEGEGEQPTTSHVSGAAATKQQRRLKRKELEEEDSEFEAGDNTSSSDDNEQQTSSATTATAATATTTTTNNHTGTRQLLPQLAKRKRIRKGAYCPPLSHAWTPNAPGCASVKEMAAAIAAHNRATKRTNRHFLTVINDDDDDDDDEGHNKQTIEIASEKVNHVAVALNHSCTGKATSKRLELQLPFQCFDVLWCDCAGCRKGPEQLLFLVTTTEGIHALSVTVDPQRGLLAEEGKLLLQLRSCRDIYFPIGSCAAMSGGFLAFSRDNSGTAEVYLLSTAEFHRGASVLNAELHTDTTATSTPTTTNELTAAVCIPSCQLTTLTLSPLGLLAGSMDGRVRLHSFPRLQESLQLALPSAVPVYSAVLAETGREEKIVVTGRMNRVLSYSVQEGGDWNVEASTLAIINRVIPLTRGGSLIYADCEAHARMILSPTHHSPLCGSFDSTLLSMDASRMHSVVALGSAAGSVFLSWPEEGLVKRLRLGSDGHLTAEYWNGPDGSGSSSSGERGDSASIYEPVCLRETIVKWSPSRMSPGLLAVLREHKTLSLLICDEYFI